MRDIVIVTIIVIIWFTALVTGVMFMFSVQEYFDNRPETIECAEPKDKDCLSHHSQDDL